MQDWGLHKEYCLKVKAAGDNTFDAILFAANETKPRLVKIPWVVGNFGDKDDPILYHKLKTDVWFKGKKKAVRTQSVRCWERNGPELGRDLCLIYDENLLINGSCLNRCIVEVTRGTAAYQWRGNILALRLTNGSFESAVMEEDLEPFVGYFDSYGKVYVYVMPRASPQQNRNKIFFVLFSVFLACLVLAWVIW